MRGKRFKFLENTLSENVIQPGKANYESLKSKWGKEIFNNDNPITLELGCGRGEYTIGLARQFPNRNFIGIDIKGDRIWAGSKIAREEQLTNVAFLRTQMQFLLRFFDENEIDEIWLTFPDPRPKKRDEKRRLCHPDYLMRYKFVLKKDGYFKFKTDNTDLFEYTLHLLKKNIKVSNLIYVYDLYQSKLNEDHAGIKTKYEKIFFEKGEKIKYMKFQFQ